MWLPFVAYENVEAFRVIDFAPPDDGTRLKKLRAAIQTIDEYQPYRGVQARRYLRRVLISHTGGSGEYYPGLKVCVLDADYLNAVDATAIAMLLVHEATHGRLEAWRIKWRGHAERAEVLCSRAEIGLASRVPNGEEHVDRVQRSLETRWWDPDQSHARQKHRLHQMRAPRWIEALVDKLQ